MKTTICLMRHGETNWNVSRRFQGMTDIPLNECGREQARLTAHYLSSVSWDCAISSPLLRAKETAGIIAQNLQLGEVYIMDELAERDVGSGTGYTPEEYQIAAGQGRLVGVESFEMVRDRAMSALTKLGEEHAGRRMIVVSHGAVINAVLSALSNGEIGTGKTALQNVCLNMLLFQNRHWEIESYNMIEHLRQDHGGMFVSLTDDIDFR